MPRKRVRIVATVIAAIVLGASCAKANRPSSEVDPGNEATGSGPVSAEVAEEGGRYRLLRGGEPYEIHGAGISGELAAFASHGGTSFRTWSTGNAGMTGRELLDDAAQHGLTAVLCIAIGRERHGFDYDDEQAVAAQLEFARDEVLKYRDHPALLVWMIGNEPNLHFTNPKVFNAINDISRMIHEVDGRHPTTTALAGFSGELAALIAVRAPDLDFVSIQMYGDILNLPERIRSIGYTRPFMVTEWGAIGHWEVQRTAWGAPIEQDSSEKAGNYLQSYQTAIAPNRDQILGAYVFLWGQKQERTPTWYGMFLADGSETETIDVMHYIWNGVWPANRSPRIERMLLDSRNAHQNVTVSARAEYAAGIVATDPDGDPLRYRWEIMRESTSTQEGGDPEPVPEALPGLLANDETADVTVTAPAGAGAYRLFVYVYDDRGNAGHANIPFLVE